MKSAAEYSLCGFQIIQPSAPKSSAALIITELKSVRPERAVPVSCEAPSDGLLLVDWLNALVYEMATRRMLFSAFVVTIEDSRLRATAWGEPVDRMRQAHNGCPARPIVDYLERVGDLKGKPIVVIGSGGGMTERGTRVR